MLTLKLEVSGGFKEEESMELFSSFVNVPVEFLPEEARAIHAECKGSPMVISMIGSLVCIMSMSPNQGLRGPSDPLYFYSLWIFGR